MKTKTKKLKLALLLLVTSALNGQPTNNLAGYGTALRDVGTDVAVFGVNTYVVGESSQAAFIAMYSNANISTAPVVVTGTPYSAALSVHVNSSGVYVTGHTTSNQIFGVTFTGTNNGNNLFVAKFNHPFSSTSLAWVTFGVNGVSGPCNEMNRGVGITADGSNVYVTGYLSGDVSFASPYTTPVVTGACDDVFVAAFDDVFGNLLGSIQYPAVTDVSRICHFGTNLYITGRDSAYGDTTQYAYVQRWSNTLSMGPIVRIFGSNHQTYSFFRGNDVIADATGVYAVGTFHEDAIFNMGTPSAFTLHNADAMNYTSDDAFIAKYDLALTSCQWANSVGTGYGEFGTGITFSTCPDEIYIGGEWQQDFWSPIGLDERAFLSRFRMSDGALLATTTFTGHYPRPSAIGIDANKTIYMTGAFRLSMSDNSGNTIYTSGIGDEDAFLLQSEFCGLDAKLWLEGYTMDDPYFQIEYSGGRRELFTSVTDGVFSGSGVVFDNGHYYFDPHCLVPGIYQLTYTYNDPCCGPFTFHMDIEVTGCAQILPTPASSFIRPYTSWEAHYMDRALGDVQNNSVVNVRYGNHDNNGFITLMNVLDDGTPLLDRVYTIPGKHIETDQVIQVENGCYLISGIENGTTAFLLKVNGFGSVIWYNSYPNPGFTPRKTHICALTHTADYALAYDCTVPDNILVTVIVDPMFGNNGSAFNHDLGYANVQCESICPLANMGFAVAGWSGHNGFDQYSGMMLSFNDLGARTNLYPLFNLGSAVPGDLLSPTTSHVTKVKSVKELGNGNLGICGYLSNHDPAGNGATYKSGFYCEYDANGVVGGTLDVFADRQNFIEINDFDFDVNSNIHLTGTYVSGGRNKTLYIHYDPVLKQLISPAKFYTAAASSNNYWGSNDIGSNMYQDVSGAVMIYAQTNCTDPADPAYRPYLVKVDDKDCSTTFPLDIKKEKPSLKAWIWWNDASFQGQMGDQPDMCEDFTCMPDHCSGSGQGGSIAKDNKTSSVAGAGTTQHSSVVLYPNPSTGDVTVSNLPLLNAAFRISITDITGKEIFTTSAYGDRDVKLPTQFLQGGVYFVSIRNNEWSRQIRFVKQ